MVLFGKFRCWCRRLKGLDHDWTFKKVKGHTIGDKCRLCGADYWDEHLTVYG